jgi:hypothetical protein
MISRIRFLAFLRELFFMPIFQLGISATVGGLVLADWFCTEVLRYPELGELLRGCCRLGQVCSSVLSPAISNLAA